MTDQQAPKRNWLKGFATNVDIIFVVILGLLPPIIALRHPEYQVDYWHIATWAYITLAIVSFVPVWRATRRKITKHDIDASLDAAKNTISRARPLSDIDPIKEALILNYERLVGTLVFWKFEAAKYKAGHFYCLFWTIPSAVLIPILTQAVAGSGPGTTMVTVVSAFTAILLAFHRGFKIEENYRAFRHGESEFYDLFRRMLDRPNALGTDPNSQLESYLLEAETIRRFVRNAETNNMATLDEAKQMLKDIEPREAKPAPSPKKPKTSKKR